MAPTRPVAVGRVGRPHGLNGEVRVDPLGGLPRGLEGYQTFYLERGGELQPVEIRSHRRQGKVLLVRFAGCSSPDEARRLTHALLCVERDEMPPLEVDEYYHVDLLGCRVLDEAGTELGTVEDVWTAGPQDVLVIRDGALEWMLPVVAEFVLHLEVEEKRIVVRPPEGLRP